MEALNLDTATLRELAEAVRENKRNERDPIDDAAFWLAWASEYWLKKTRLHGVEAAVEGAARCLMRARFYARRVTDAEALARLDMIAKAIEASAFLLMEGGR